MTRTGRLLAVMCIMAASAITSEAQVQFGANIHIGNHRPPAPRREYIPAPPMHGAVWVPGHWERRGRYRRYEWVNGYWNCPPPPKRHYHKRYGCR